MFSRDLLETGHGRIVASVLETSDLTRELLHRLEGCDLQNWMVGAGVVAQTIWNAAHDFSPTYGIVDVDVVYFDALNPSEEAEQAALAHVRHRLAGLGCELDVKNQARVDQWYPARFGDHIKPYRSLEDALASWPTTATAIGVSQVNGRLECLAPFGLRDLVELTIRANRVQVPRAVFQAKASRWLAHWPRLRVLPWDEGLGRPQERLLPHPGQAIR